MVDQPGSATAVMPSAPPPPAPPPDWDSPLWGRPDTLAQGWSQATTELPPASPPPPERPGRRLRTRWLALGVVLLLVLAAAGGLLLHRAQPGPSASQTAPRPKVSASPAVPTPQPSASAPAPSSSGQPGPQSQPTAAALSPAQQAAVAAVSPGLVDIVTTIGSGGAHGAGTGMVLTAQGIVLTNHHVVAGATSVSVTDVGNGKTYAAKVLGYDRSHDVAVLQLTGASGLQTAPLGDSTKVAVGDQVIGLGNALGSGGAPTPAAARSLHWVSPSPRGTSPAARPNACPA